MGKDWGKSCFVLVVSSLIPRGGKNSHVKIFKYSSSRSSETILTSQINKTIIIFNYIVLKKKEKEKKSKKELKTYFFFVFY